MKGDGSIHFANNTRYLVLVISTVALSMIISNSLALNFTIICMKKEQSSLHFDTILLESSEHLLNYSVILRRNETDPIQKEADDSIFSLSERSALFSSTAVGSFLGTLPITFLTANYGLRKVLTGYGIISSIATLLTPFAVSLGFWTVMLMRILQGLGVSTSYVSIGAISAEWAPLKNSGLFVAWISCHLQFAPMFTMPVSGALCESSFGWPSVYYLHGLLSALAFVLFFYFYRDSPRFQRNVSNKELTKIEASRTSTRRVKGESQKVPYKLMLTDVVVWGIIATGASAQLGFQTFMQYGPTYLNKVIGMDVEKTGFSAALPFALSCFLKLLVGPLSDYVPLSDKGRVILFASISQYAMAACYVALAVLPSRYELLIQVFFTGVTVFSGINCVGVVKCAQLTARELSHVLMAWNTLLGSGVILLLPLGVSIVAPNNTPQEWGRIFWFIVVLILLATTFFNLVAEVKPRPWTVNTEKTEVFSVQTTETPPKTQNIC